jgi:uncharacterized protein
MVVVAIATSVVVIVVAMVVVATGKRSVFYYLRQQAMKALGIICKRNFWAVFLCLGLIVFPLPSYALTVQDVPNPRKDYGGWVTDMAQIISLDTEAKLNQLISNLERQNGDEIAVVTVPQTAPESSPKAFTTRLFKYWGIGKKGKNNGVLFLVSKGDRRVEIETGYGIERILPNTRVSNIIDSQIILHFKQGDFDGGILAGTQALVRSLSLSSNSFAPSTTNKANLTPQPSALQSNSPAYLLMVIGILLFFLVFIALVVIVVKLFNLQTPSYISYSRSSSTRSNSSDSGSSSDGVSIYSSDGGSDFGGGDSGGDGGGGDW